MTQILVALSHSHVLLASDRRLTVASGHSAGKILDEETCKLISLCNTVGIAYTGWAELQGQPTNEWIAVKLAKANSTQLHHAVDALQKATRSLPQLGIEQTFVFAGWDWLQIDQPPVARCNLVSNMFDAMGNRRSSPSSKFASVAFNPVASRDVALISIGQPLTKERGTRLEGRLHRYLRSERWSLHALRALAGEIMASSGATPTVGSRILACSFPKAAAEQWAAEGNTFMVSGEPNNKFTTFKYVNLPGSELEQFGPTFVNRGWAFTDFYGNSSADGDYRSTEVKLLCRPDR